MAGAKSRDTIRRELLQAFTVLDKGTGRVSRSLLKALCDREDAIITIEEVRLKAELNLFMPPSEPNSSNCELFFQNWSLKI